MKQQKIKKYEHEIICVASKKTRDAYFSEIYIKWFQSKITAVTFSLRGLWGLEDMSLDMPRW